MIKTLVACTREVDDETLAIDEIMSALKIETELMKNSIGIISCHYEFVLSGIVKAVSDALPFDVMGTISSPLSITDNADSLLLTIMVITGDDIEFESALTPSLLEQPKTNIAESYKTASAERLERPSLILAFAPFMPQNSGDDYVNVLSEVSNGAPCFGTIAIDDSDDFENCFMIYNGEHYPERMSMILVYGKIHPKFYFANISPERALDKSAIITKSDGHIIMELNGRSVDEFFADLGLTKASEDGYAMSSLPFLLDYNDGTPKVSKVFIGLTPERYALCAGATPEGSTLDIATTDKDDVLLTTEQIADKVIEDCKGASGLLIYTCISRGMVLAGDQYSEINLINRKMAGKLPFMMAYSGGEFCPTQDSPGKAVNRFHNNAFIACLF